MSTRPRFNSVGALDNLAVVRTKEGSYGGLYIQGEGLSAPDVNQLDLVATFIRVEAPIVAKDLVVSSGRHRFGYNDRSTHDYNIWGESLNAPTLDSNALGGMYTDKIKIVTVGFAARTKLAGEIVAKSGNAEIHAGSYGEYAKINASGNVIVRSLYSTFNENVSAGGYISIHSEGDIWLQGTHILQNSGEMVSGGSTNISTGRTWRGTPALDLKGDGIHAYGDLNLNLGGTLSIGKTANLVSGKAIKISARSITQQEGSDIVASQSFQYDNATDGWSEFRGNILSPKIYINSNDYGKYAFHGKVSNGSAVNNFERVFNINTTGDIEIHTPIETDAININKNSIKATRNISSTKIITAKSGAFVEFGDNISSKNINFIGDPVSLKGKVSSSVFNASAINSFNITNDISADTIKISGGSLDLKGGLAAKGVVAITATNNLNVASKISGQSIEINGASINLNSEIASKTGVSIAATSKITAGSNTKISSASASIIASKSLIVDKGAIISASKSLMAIAENISLSGTLSSEYRMDVIGSNSLTIGTAGRILNIAKKDTSERAVVFGKSFLNNGIIAADNFLFLRSDSSYKNSKGSVFATGIDSNIRDLRYNKFSKYKPD